MSYLDVAKSALEEYRTRSGANGATAKEAKEANKGTGAADDPLPPAGDPRRIPSELLAEADRAGARIVLERGRLRVAPTARAPEALAARVEAHQADLIRYYRAVLTPARSSQPAAPRLLP